jgi:leucyl/phenylalanyl-tRNA---protein transferase
MLVLTPENVLAAYRQGIFPMADSRTGPVNWYCPDPRGILPLDAVRVPRSLARLVRSGRFEFRCDADFAATIDGCAARAQTWISPEIRRTYLELHRLGHAHSIEAWTAEGLVGGLYGVHVAGAFMGESVFHRRADAGRACVVALVEHLRARGFSLLDIQQVTPMTSALGGTYISRSEYLKRLKEALRRPAEWGTFTFSSRR